MKPGAHDKLNVKLRKTLLLDILSQYNNNMILNNELIV